MTNTGGDLGLEEESEAPQDEALNEMIARNEEELAFFNKIDVDRKKTDKSWMDAIRKA